MPGGADQRAPARAGLGASTWTCGSRTGCGSSSPTAPGGAGSGRGTGTGLIGLTERVELLGGTVSAAVRRRTASGSRRGYRGRRDHPGARRRRRRARARRADAHARRRAAGSRSSAQAADGSRGARAARRAPRRRRAHGPADAGHGRDRGDPGGAARDRTRPPSSCSPPSTPPTRSRPRCAPARAATCSRTPSPSGSSRRSWRPPRASRCSRPRVARRLMDTTARTGDTRLAARASLDLLTERERDVVVGDRARREQRRHRPRAVPLGGHREERTCRASCSSSGWRTGRRWRCSCTTRTWPEPTPDYRGPVLLSDRDIRAELESGRVALEPYDASMLQPSSIDVRLDRFFRLFDNHKYPFIDPSADQPELTRLVEVEAGRVVRPAPRRVRARVDVRGRDASRRHRRAARGQVVARAARTAHALDRGVHRPRVHRAT